MNVFSFVFKHGKTDYGILVSVSSFGRVFRDKEPITFTKMSKNFSLVRLIVLAQTRTGNKHPDFFVNK